MNFLFTGTQLQATSRLRLSLTSLRVRTRGQLKCLSDRSLSCKSPPAIGFFSVHSFPSLGRNRLLIPHPGRMAKSSVLSTCPYHISLFTSVFLRSFYFVCLQFVNDLFLLIRIIEAGNSERLPLLVFLHYFFSTQASSGFICEHVLPARRSNPTLFFRRRKRKTGAQTETCESEMSVQPLAHRSQVLRLVYMSPHERFHGLLFSGPWPTCASTVWFLVLQIIISVSFLIVRFCFCHYCDR